MIPVNTPSLIGNEAKYLTECINTGWVSSDGPFVERLEKSLADYTGRKHAIAVCNGSAALDAAVIALKIGPGDEVIIPSLTIISCALAVIHAGAIPVPVDCDPVTWNMTPELVEDAITPRTKAIMAVHIYGLPVEMGRMLALAEKHGLYVIEDAAEAIGQECKDLDLGGKVSKSKESKVMKCGSMGDISTFSFYPNKHMTTGEGGMLLTDDEALADRCRSARNLFFGKSRRFVHEELGYNMRMSNMQAAVGLAQFERLDDALARKREIGCRYQEQLSGLPYVQLPLPRSNYADNLYWVFCLVIDSEHSLCAESASLTRASAPFPSELAMSQLAAHGIGTRPFFWPMHEQPVFREMGLFDGVVCPVAEKLARNGFYIPSGLALKDDEIDEVARVVRSVLQ